MELSKVGADLFGEAEAAVLCALVLQGRPVSGREIGRVADVNQSSARRALQRWAEVGPVTSTSSSHATLFQLNRAHVLWHPIEAILAAPSRLEHAVAELVESRFGGSATVAIFGSVARHDSTGSSDIDLVLVLPDRAVPSDGERLVDDLRDLIESLTGNEAHIVEVNHQQLRDMAVQGDPLAVAWATDARTLSGADLARSIASLQ